MGKKISILIVLSLAFMIQAHGQAKPAWQEGGAQTETTTPTTSKDYSEQLGFLLAAEGGGGLISGLQPTAYAGIKFGGDLLPRPWTWNVSLGYDRIRAQNGFSAETSGLLPVFRMPGPRRDPASRYLRVYAGPGIGARASEGAFGPYMSAHVMIGLFSDNALHYGTVSPYIEYERRFPFTSLAQGDNRLTFGLMFALCGQC